MTIDRQIKTSCNDGHIGLVWMHPGVCPLCSCFKRIKGLRVALKEAANSLGVIAVAGREGSSLEDVIEVRDFARSRQASAKASLARDGAGQ